MPVNKARVNSFPFGINFFFNQAVDGRSCSSNQPNTDTSQYGALNFVQSWYPRYRHHHAHKGAKDNQLQHSRLSQRMQLPQNDQRISRNDRRHKLNLMVVENGKPVRTGRKLNEKGKLQRYSKVSGKFIA